jgi:hypothetical protein
VVLCSYVVRRVPTGLLFQYDFDGVGGGGTTIRVNLICREGQGVGLPEDATEPTPGSLEIDWFNGYATHGMHETPFYTKNGIHHFAKTGSGQA